jgi:hypothetical protein
MMWSGWEIIKGDGFDAQHPGGDAYESSEDCMEPNFKSADKYRVTSFGDLDERSAKH